MVHAGDARGLRTRGGADTGQVGGPKRTGVPAAPGRPERAAVFRRLPVGALTPARAPPGQRGFRSDDRVGERAHVAGRERRRRLLPVQPRPADLKPGVLHGGLEYRQTGVLLHLGRLAAGRVVAALDAKSFQDRGWDVGWSGVTGLELGDALAGPDGGWRWSVLVRAYTGPAPYGEFFRDRVASLGVGLGLAL